MSSSARLVLVVALLLGTALLVARGLGPAPTLVEIDAGEGCAVPVEWLGEGIRCLDEGTAESLGLAAGDRLHPDGGHDRMAPARLAALGVLLDANQATAAELEALRGVGPSLAARIVAGRPYRSVRELAAVPGLGWRRLARLQGRLAVLPTDGGIDDGGER